MEHDNKIKQKLAFGQIVQSVVKRCLSPAGERLANAMSFSSDIKTVEHEIGLTDEFLSILLSAKAFPCEDFFDMSGELKRLKLKGTFISLENLVQLNRSLKTICSCVEFFEHDEQNAYPLLKEICSQVFVDEQIIKSSNRLLASDGTMADNASETLFSIRQNKHRAEFEAGKRLRKLLEVSKKEGWTPPEAELTIRDGRGVIPIASSNKRRLQGFVVDESSSGQTSFIEPAEVVELHNRLRELEFEEKREIVRILTEFTDFVRPYIPTLLGAYDFLARIDFLRAKAKYALSINAGKPVLRQDEGFVWYEARHPLLEESLKRHGKSIVPLKIELSNKKRILIISGPNAGGKSVCLKTVGLLQYMLQCGLLIPAKQTSEFCIFERIFIDIGDQQSIESDLSTYSSHLMSMKHLCELANRRTLFLIDECGSGTDPNVGGAIAEAVLEHLNSKQAFGIVTTHYSNLKLLSERCDTISNAAMLFDTKALRPLYKLSIGTAGSSFAFEIARTIGLPDKIIKSAEEKVGSGFVDFEQSLQSMAVEKMEIRNKQSQLQLTDELLDNLVREYQDKIRDISNREKQIILEAKRQANEILKSANKQIEQTIHQIKTSKADKQTTMSARKDIQRSIETQSMAVKQLESEVRQEQTLPENTKTHIPFDPSPIEEGDIVLVSGQNSYATVQKLKRNKAEVICGQINMTLPLSHLKKVNKTSYLRQQKTASASRKPSFGGLMDKVNDLRAKFEYRLDLRGSRADEALAQLAKYIDTARLLGESEVSVLHGKGDGILKTVLRDYLKTNPEVESFRAERVEFGGEGITIIKLK